MPQTLLGLLGILLASTLSLHQIRSGMETEEKLREVEVQALAAEVAMGQLAALEQFPFDEAVKTNYAMSVAELTPVVGDAFVRLGPDPAGDDLDDAHNTQAITTHTLRDGQTGVRLRTQVRIGYVSEADGVTASLVPTRFKRATVTVASLDVPADTVTLSQLVSCGSYCSW